LVSTYEERSSIAIGVTDDLTKKFDAVEIVNLASKIMEGKGGGGRKDMALAGAKDVKNINEAIKVIEELIKDRS
jgi:alanyl-tRNA synthetase